MNENNNEDITPIMESDNFIEKKTEKKEVSKNNSTSDNDDSRFVCNVCLDPVQDPVVTVCGHLYW